MMNKRFDVSMVRQIAQQYKPKIVRTVQDLIRIDSPSLQEKGVADYIIQKMHELEYDTVERDTYGSVFGTMHGTGNGSSVMLNCHMDVVDAGDVSKWEHGPFSGDIADNRIWGRGASDTKGTLAIQLYTPVILKKAGLMPAGNLVTACVVAEELAGFGGMMQARERRMLTDYAVVGEATENDIAIASRGCMHIVIRIIGKSCHASIPANGHNPIDYLKQLLPALDMYPKEHDDIFGDSVFSVTRITSSEKGNNIIPNEVNLFIDYRQSGTDTEENVVERFRKILANCPCEGITTTAEAIYTPLVTYTGAKGKGYQGEYPFYVDPETDYIQQAKMAIEEAVGHSIRTKPWSFATDTGHYAAQGVKCLGYSPAEIALCHSVRDSIDLTMMDEGILGYAALAFSLANTRK